MSQQISEKVIERDEAISALKKIVQEWREAATGLNLIEVKGSVGLLMTDVAMSIGIYPEELGLEALEG